METEKMIPAIDFCRSHDIEFSFIALLNASGLIDIVFADKDIFIPETELSRVEKLIRLHVDLEINIAGIESITYLLQRQESMQEEIVKLNNRLRFYEKE